ncbi:haloacid dehalogenase type II [Agrococcus sp. ProA11]|uniref:haloacid dehalogenase type II n=1 Tax=Agrococcus chionoecetis TaxID=3153752 RepID=UPI0032609A66
MTVQPLTIIFDVNETLSDLSTVGDAFERVGAGPGSSDAWFATVLRDGFALTASGSDARFAELAANSARQVLGGLQLTTSLDEAVDIVLDAFASVSLHADVAPALQSLRGAGHRLLTLSNGPTSTAERLLQSADALHHMDSLLTVEGHSLWKPARDSYRSALSRARVAGRAYLVAVHPWDIHGAARAGLSTVWVNRRGATYPSHFTQPDITVRTLEALAERLA